MSERLLRWEAFTDDEMRVLFNMTDLLRDRELTHGPASPGEQAMMKAIEDEWEIRVRRMSGGTSFRK